MRKLLVAISIMVAVFNNVRAQDDQYIQNMEAALAIHDTASNVASEIKGLNAFRKLSDKYDNEWLPSYWTAYLCTQVARLKGRSSGFPESNLQGLCKTCHSRKTAIEDGRWGSARPGGGRS